MKMTSNRPYFIRAIYDWVVENNMTPYILVDAEYPEVTVPQEYVSNGRVVLNISPSACRGLHMDNTKIVFTARFGGISNQIFVPPSAVLAIYAKENGRGMEFGEDYDGDGSSTLPPTPPVGSGSASKKPTLTLVK